MKPLLALFTCLFIVNVANAQPVFSRNELPTMLFTPWEITYGPDGYLWITEANAVVSRVDPITGAKTVVYTATDYFEGGDNEINPVCTAFHIGHGTMGLALDPDFTQPTHSFIYYVYSYNSGTVQTPLTKLKVVKLTWDAANNQVSAHTDLITQMPIGFDHYGGRLLAVKQNGNSYLYLSIGDNGISEVNAPNCYNPLGSNPNNFAQNPTYKNGKIHRFNIDGTIPNDNPIANNSFFTRGHRNPQGLMYNPTQNLLYDSEHGDRTDDEVNILYKGMNYGWKNVRGYHGDNNIDGETDYINNYIADPQIANDSLVQPLFAWCATPQPADPNGATWCTVAPSDGIYYNNSAIPTWQNSLLVVTLKDGNTTDQAVYQFKLTTDGKSLAPPIGNDSNPQPYFGGDHLLNGRLRDIALSPDGTKIFLINNGGVNGETHDKITVYTYLYTGIENNSAIANSLQVYPNPGNGNFNLSVVVDKTTKATIGILDAFGRTVATNAVALTSGQNNVPVTLANATQGIYLLTLNINGVTYSKKVVVE